MWEHTAFFNYSTDCVGEKILQIKELKERWGITSSPDTVDTCNDHPAGISLRDS